MSNRVRISQDKADLVQNLVLSSHNPQGVFSTYADLMAFAAALGKSYNCPITLGAIAKEPSPISIEVFNSRGYESLFKLLGITSTHNLNIISSYEENQEEARIKIFEEYANGGLDRLQQQLKGAVDYSERILLILTQEKECLSKVKNNNFDLRKFIE